MLLAFFRTTSPAAFVLFSKTEAFSAYIVWIHCFWLLAVYLFKA